MKISKISKGIKNPKLAIVHILSKLIKNDRIYLSIIYRLYMGRKCNFDKPITFQEKLQWIKLHDRKDIYHQMVDKYDAKQFIKERVGEEYVVPTLGIWNKFEDIDFESLPDKFIMKNTYDSASYFICKDKSKLNISEVRNRLKINSRKVDYYIYSREWPYKGLKRRIIAEPLLDDGKGDYLIDYKFFTFNGEPKFFYVTSNRGKEGGLKEDFFDVKGNLLEINQKGYYNNELTPELPRKLNQMVEFCKILSKNTYHLRVDFYEVNDKIYCGELTFFDGGGLYPFTPEKYNRILGDWIKLPIDN